MQVVALNAAWIVVRSLSIHSKVMYCVERGVRNDACVMLVVIVYLKYWYKGCIYTDIS